MSPRPFTVTYLAPAPGQRPLPAGRGFYACAAGDVPVLGPFKTEAQAEAALHASEARR